MTKKEVSQTFAKYRSAGAVVLTFNSNRGFRGAFKGHPDHEILTNGHLIYVEVKIGMDKIRSDQARFAEKIKEVETKSGGVVRYRVVSKKEDLELVCKEIDKILTKKR